MSKTQPTAAEIAALVHQKYPDLPIRHVTLQRVSRNNTRVVKAQERFDLEPDETAPRSADAEQLAV